MDSTPSPPEHLDSIDPTPFAAPVPGRVTGRRSDALAPLSRDHHHALAQAMALKRATAEAADEVWAKFAEFWRSEGSEHFAEEESILIPAYAAVADPSHPAVVRTLLEHALIRAKVARLEESETPPAAELQELGRWLELHVRLEERILFTLIEHALPAEVQERLVRKLA
mgnify:CR=1 FL=1